MVKICSVCKTEKDIECFHKHSVRKDGHRSECKVCSKKYDNTEAHILSRRAYNKTNKAKDYYREWQKEKRHTDIQFRLRNALYTRLKNALKNNWKNGSAIRDLGCSISQLKDKFEKNWKEGMTWDNYGNKEGQWSIDHIKPLSKFDLTDRNQLLEAVNYRNLQPMWHVDNVKKSNKEGTYGW